jgi:hypothetical protein
VGTKAALAGDEQVPTASFQPFDGDRLDQTMPLDGGGKLLQCIRVEVLARLIRVGLNLRQAESEDPRRVLRRDPPETVAKPFLHGLAVVALTHRR